MVAGPYTVAVDSLAQNRRETIEEVVRVLGGEWPTALVNPEVKARARVAARPGA